MAELISVEEANVIGRIPVSGRTSDENAKYDAFIINQLNPSREQQQTNPYSSNPANASEYRNYIDWRVNQGLPVGSTSSGEEVAVKIGIGDTGNYQSTKDAAKAAANNILTQAYTGVDRAGNLIGGVVGAGQEVAARFIGSAPNGGKTYAEQNYPGGVQQVGNLLQQPAQQSPTTRNPYADAAEQFVVGRPGFTPLNDLGDPQTQIQLQRAQAGLELSQGAKESLVAGILGNQMRAAQERGAYREVQYYGNEIQKTAQNAVERASEYHYIGMSAGVPIPSNPFEYKGDLAVEFLKGSPQYQKDVFSPVSGQMSSTLPFGGLGLQGYQWELAKVGQQGATRENYNVDFNPAISALGNAEGKYGPYGFLYGGPNYTGTPSSSGIRMQTPINFTPQIEERIYRAANSIPGRATVGGPTIFSNIVEPEKPVVYVRAPDGTMQPDYMMGGNSTRLVGGNKVAAISTQISQDYISTLPSPFVSGALIKPTGDIRIPFTDVKVRVPGVSDAISFFTPAIFVSGRASSVTEVNPTKSGGVDYSNVFINPETNKPTRELTTPIGGGVYETVTLPETKTVYGFTGVQQRSGYDTLLDEQYRSRIPDAKTGEIGLEISQLFNPMNQRENISGVVSRGVVYGAAERFGLDTTHARKDDESLTALVSPTKGVYTLAYERPELAVVEYASGGIFGAGTRIVSATASRSATLSRAAPFVEKYGGKIFTALYGGSIAYEETEGFTKFEPENVSGVKSHIVVGFPSMAAGFRAGYALPELGVGGARNIGGGVLNAARYVDERLPLIEQSPIRSTYTSRGGGNPETSLEIRWGPQMMIERAPPSGSGEDALLGPRAKIGDYTPLPPRELPRPEKIVPGYDIKVERISPGYQPPKEIRLDIENARFVEPRLSTEMPKKMYPGYEPAPIDISTGIFVEPKLATTPPNERVPLGMRAAMPVVSEGFMPISIEGSFKTPTVVTPMRGTPAYEIGGRGGVQMMERSGSGGLKTIDLRGVGELKTLDLKGVKTPMEQRARAQYLSKLGIIKEGRLTGRELRQQALQRIESKQNWEQSVIQKDLPSVTGLSEFSPQYPQSAAGRSASSFSDAYLRTGPMQERVVISAIESSNRVFPRVVGDQKPYVGSIVSPTSESSMVSIRRMVSDRKTIGDSEYQRPSVLIPDTTSRSKNTRDKREDLIIAPNITIGGKDERITVTRGPADRVATPREDRGYIREPPVVPGVPIVNMPKPPAIPPIGPVLGVGMGGGGGGIGGWGPSTRKRNYKNPVVDIEYLSSLPGRFGSFGRAKAKKR